ncbi:uncharacterized protein LOC108907727 [Anoplophora glabripennis]|uniref:uncharacterized protein LOC108907727 n=1 Tax=Anoplophora glabripennis TaxID=217634 RepID=UPI000875A12D|nr:uncharacterized protein LOC108907727 [Anoplophora glabripennis]
MCRTVGAFFFLGLGAAVLCVPLKDKLMVDLGGDTAVVESTVREARQAPDHIEELLQPDKKDGQESKTLYSISGESKDDKKNKHFLDDFDFAYFGGDNSGLSKFVQGGGENESGDGKSQSYETNESYESGGSGSYDSGDKNEGESSSTSHSYDSKDGNGKSAAYGGEEEQEEEEH